MEKYWRSLDEYQNGLESQNDKPVEDQQKNAVLDLMDGKSAETSASRRDFLKIMGFSFATAALASSCEKPVQKAIPYLIKPEEITPGKANYYATGFFDGIEYCSVVAKVRDGRPIKLEANKLSNVSRGGTSARVQAAILSLYDESRLQSPMHKKKKIDWEALDQIAKEKLKQDAPGRKVILTSTIISPSIKQLRAEMQEKYPDLEWISYDEVSTAALRRANKEILGEAIIPGYRFDKADYILSFEADFLGTWLAPVEFAHGYAQKRSVSKEHTDMSKHIQFESGFSLTGSNADERIPVSPAASKAILAKIYNVLAAKSGARQITGIACDHDVSAYVDGLLENSGRSIVISGSNDIEVQKMVASLNGLLNNYGSTLDLERTIELARGEDQKMFELSESLTRGEVSVLIMYNVNPVYSYKKGEELGRTIGNTALSVYIGSAKNESAKACQYIAPDHHFLEAWGDAEPQRNSFSLQQPAIHPLYDTRSFQDTLLKWMENETSYYEYLKDVWRTRIFKDASGTASFANWWNACLQNGVLELPAAASKVSPNYNLTDDIVLSNEGDGFTLGLYTPVGLLDGRHANNPWLQELPDPISKVCWDNYLSVSVADAAKMGLENEDVVEIKGVKLPVLVQPGQAKGTLSLALGYGRTVAGKVGDHVGVNGFQFVGGDAHRTYHQESITITPVGEKYELAMTQTHHSMEERPIVRETSLEEYKNDPSAGNHFHLEAEKHHMSMYEEKSFDGYHWGLSIDQNKCIGCNNCVVSCIAENNIATVGKTEVKNRRIMHWMRIDRYFSEEADNPKVYHQPVMCQHCDNAPCENVCPVSATMHSNEGLNQVAYVRCIGTKYCINNCPYRVRRFNWFKYVDNDAFNFHLNDNMSKLVLNPDVTVRGRGVVEKCSFCVQRIQEKKMEAKLEDRALQDGEVQPACVQSCPAGALVFGNMNDEKSEISRLKREERNYHLLEQLHTEPSVGYLTKVRNTKASLSSHEKGHESPDHTKDTEQHS